MWLPSSSCASKERTINVQTFQLSFHTCLSVCLWLSNKQAMWAQRCRLCGQSRGEQKAVGSEWLTVWRLLSAASSTISMESVETCWDRPAERSKWAGKERKWRQNKKREHMKPVRGRRGLDLCQVGERDSGTRKADIFALMKGKKVDWQRRSDG